MTDNTKKTLPKGINLPQQFTTITEISKQTNKQDSLNVSEERLGLGHLASLSEKNPFPIVEVDLVGHIRYINPAAHHLFPDLFEKELGHSWFMDWETVVKPFCEGRNDTYIRDITIGRRYYQQFFYCNSQERFIQIYGFDITERKYAEEALRESEERFRAFMNNTTTVAWMKDELGRYVYLNNTYEKHFGVRLEDRLGKTDFELWPPEFAKDFWKNDQKVLRLDHPIEFEEESLIPSEDPCTLWIFKFPFQDTLGRKYIGGIGVDITERKKAEEALKAKQMELAAANEVLQAQTEELNTAYQKLQCQSVEIREHMEIAERARDEAERRAAELDATISSIAMGVCIFDVYGNVVRENEYAQKFLVLSREDYNLGYHERRIKLKLFKPDGTPYEIENAPLYRALRGEIIRDEEIMVARNPDKPKWLSATFAPILDNTDNQIGVIFAFTDITERKRKVEDLLASERELLKVTLNSLGEGVVAVDREERIIFINETAAKLTGHSPEEAIGQPLEKVLYIFDDKTSELINNVISLKTSSNPMFVTRDLHEVPIALNSSPIKAADGQIIGTVIVFQDISDRLKIQQGFSKAEKLESLGILAGGIAHDFNNILGAILSNIQLAMLKLEKNEDIRKYLANTVETTRKASELTRQLLTFSKGGAPVRKDASLIDLIKDTAEFALRGAKIKAEFAIPNNLWPANIDESQISQVIHNLVINAKQAMPRGGIILITAENVTFETHCCFKPGGYVSISVQDQGIGIPKENLAKIFDPFFTTKKEGNGLGLATSYSIINHHDGYIDVESQEGEGTTFFVYLPASNGGVVSVDSCKEIAASGAGYKILLMDDEENILNAVGEMLKHYGYQVVLATDGDMAIEAFKKARNSGEPFDAVIMDLTVPGRMGGQEAIATLRDIDPKIKAVVSSGYANDPIMADFERFGFMGVVSKPYRIDELKEVLLKVINPDQLSLELKY